MAKTALDMTPMEWRKYRLLDAIKRREKTHGTMGEVREREAWSVARSAGQLLREEFAARKVVVFGSLARKEGFGLWSDIDLAAWGIPRGNFYSAVAAVTGLSPSFKVDLVDVEECRPSLREVIETEGIEV